MIFHSVGSEAAQLGVVPSFSGRVYPNETF